LDKNLEVKVDLSDLDVTKDANCFELNSSDVMDRNDFENPSRVKINSRRMTIPDRVFSLQIPAHSLSVFEFPLQTGIN
jgi:alpha-L-arabinofuranosidase